MTHQFTFLQEVLVRNKETETWFQDYFFFINDDKDADRPFVCVGMAYKQCIPLEGNEHLLGITKDVEEG